MNTKLLPLNYLADLILINPTVGLAASYAIEQANTYDQALAAARFSLAYLQVNLEPHIRQAVSEIGTNLLSEDAFQLARKVASTVINDYSFSISQHMRGSLATNFTKRHDA